MVFLLGAIIGIAILYAWLRGHWFGWILAFFPIAFAVQVVMSNPHGYDPLDLVAMRAAGVLIVTGIPCFAWGSLRRALNQQLYRKF